MNVHLAITSPSPPIRTWAALNLMELSILQDRASIFERFRLAIQLRSLEPWAEVWYRRLVALGYSRFGQEDQAARELQEAYAFAEKYGMDEQCLVY